MGEEHNHSSQQGPEVSGGAKSPPPGQLADGTPPQPLSVGKYLLVAGLGFLICGLDFVYFTTHATDFVTQGIENIAYYTFLVILGLSSATFLVGALQAFASVTGQVFGMRVVLGGPAAAAFLVVAGGAVYFPLKDPKPVILAVKLVDQQQKDLQEIHGGILTLRFPKQSLIPDYHLIPDGNGEASVEMPRTLLKQTASIQLIGDSPNYQLEPGQQSVLVGDATANVVAKKLEENASALPAMPDPSGAMALQSQPAESRSALFEDGSRVPPQGRFLNASFPEPKPFKSWGLPQTAKDKAMQARPNSDLIQFQTLQSQTFQGAVRLKYGNQYVGPDFALSNSPQIWTLWRGYWGPFKGYWVCIERAKCWQAHDSLQFWNADGRARWPPQDWELFVIEVADQAAHTVRFRNYGRYIYVAGSRIQYGSSQSKATPLTVEFVTQGQLPLRH
ncbi:MAG TPA: hypothetical protein VLW54_04565 [Candidatus Acidoferrales bacterium]|nr:hypothetical protein [Candidatus Acidoferrales bacterium]